MGSYYDLHYYNREHTENYTHKVLTFARWSDTEKLVITSNFDDTQAFSLILRIPSDLISKWGLKDGNFQLEEQLYGKQSYQLEVLNGLGKLAVDLPPLGSLILKLK